MSLEAIVQKPNRADITANKIAEAGGKGLELLVHTGVNAAYAANPLRDVKNFFVSGYNIAKEGISWKKYKAELKKGKFLGKGNLANMLFTTGIVASGIYPGLLALRAGIGAGAYLGKRYLTTDKNVERMSSFTEKRKKSLSRLGKTFLGIPRDKIENYLSKKNIEKELKLLRNDSYYRQKALPTVMDAAIAAKGYSGLIGFKWLSGALSKGSAKVEQSTKSTLIRKIAKAGAKTTGFTRNIFSDTLSALVFASGAYHLHENGTLAKLASGKYYDDAKENIEYASSGDLIKDIKAYFSEGKYKKDIAKVVSGAADDVAAFVKAQFKAAAQKAEQVVQDPVAAIINPEEKYAVVVAGYDAEGTGFFGMGPKTNERFLMEQCQIYHDLLDMGFEPENIRVLIPGGLDPKHSDSHYPEGWEELKKAYSDDSYSHNATEANLEKILRGMSTKVDGNDTFVFYLTTHGNEGLEFDDKTYEFRRPSYAAINNGRDQVHDYELAEYAKGIEGGREIYFIDSCHSGGFAKELGKGNDVCIAACRKDQPAVMHMNGDSAGSYFIEELKKNGGIDTSTSYEKVKTCLKSAMKKFKSSWARWNSTAQAQTPIYGNQSRTEPYTVLAS